MTEQEARQEKGVQGAQEEVTRPEGRANKYGSPLTLSSASMKYMAQGNAALYIKHLLMALTHTHTPQIYGSKSAWHTQDLIITLQLKMCPSVSILSLI